MATIGVERAQAHSTRHRSQLLVDSVGRLVGSVFKPVFRIAHCLLGITFGLLHEPLSLQLFRADGFANSVFHVPYGLIGHTRDLIRRTSLPKSWRSNPEGPAAFPLHTPRKERLP